MDRLLEADNMLLKYLVTLFYLHIYDSPLHWQIQITFIILTTSSVFQVSFLLQHHRQRKPNVNVLIGGNMKKDEDGLLSKF